MSRQIYRQAALDRLASPEQLDRPHALVGARGWTALIVLVLGLVGAASWSLFSIAPVKVKAEGIVLQQDGLVEIVADNAGRIETMNLKPGNRVSAGLVVAEFQRSDLQRDIERTTAELTEAKDRYDQLQTFYHEREARQSQIEKARLKGIQETESLVSKRETMLSKRIESLGKLVKSKIILQSRLVDVELDLANARERLARLNDEAKKLAISTIERNSRRDLALLDERLKVEALTRQFNRLTAELSEQRVLKSPHSGVVVEVKVNRGDVITAGTAIATVAPLEQDREDPIAVLYISPADGKRVKLGMPVEVVPTIFQRQRYGHIKGRVTFVSSVPATAVGMRAVLRNEQLVDQLSKGTAPFEIRVRFIKEERNASGLAWSASKGPPGPLHSGTLLNAAIVVDRVPLADLVVPGLSRRIGVKQDG